MNALADDKVADYINENFVATYMKVGTFAIVNGQKVGGNVASYFCLSDGSVVHAVPGKVNANTLLTEARWAYETRRYALTRSSLLGTGHVDMFRFAAWVGQAHEERYALEKNPGQARSKNKTALYGRLPKKLPKDISQQGQAHWLLGTTPLAHLDDVFPVVWEQILDERLSGLPVAKR